MDLRSIEDIDIDELTDYFSKCVLPTDKDSLSTKLKDTASARKIYLENNERSVLDSLMDLYLVSPDLVNLFIQFDFYSVQSFVMVFRSFRAGSPRLRKYFQRYRQKCTEKHVANH